eukprot:416078_1
MNIFTTYQNKQMKILFTVAVKNYILIMCNRRIFEPLPNITRNALFQSIFYQILHATHYFDQFIATLIVRIIQIMTKRKSNTNNKDQPPSKRRKKNQKNILLFDDINSFTKNFYVQGFISQIGVVRVNKANNAKYQLIVLMQVKNGKIRSMRVYCYAECLSKVKSLKRNDFIEVLISTTSTPNFSVSTTCQIIGSIGGKAKGGIKKIKNQSMEFDIKNPSKKDIEDLSKNSDIQLAAVITNVGVPENRNTKKGKQTITQIKLNAVNKFSGPGQIWNLPKKTIKKGDVIQIIKGKKK